MKRRTSSFRYWRGERRRSLRKRSLVCRLRLDTAPFLAFLREASALPEAAQEIFRRFEGGLELVRFDAEAPTAFPASEIWIRLEPANCLLDFVAALRTGDADA